MKLFDSILINGDSYSAPGKEGQKVYADYLGESYSVPVSNYAVSGSNNDRIARSTIEYVHLHLHRRPLVIIGWSFIRRIEVWYYGDKSIFVPDQIQNPDSKLVTLDFLLNKGYATIDQKASILPDPEIHKKLTDFYTNLFFLANWLEKLDLPYLFFSAAKNTDCPVECFPYIKNLSTTQWCVKNQYIYNLHDFCIMNWALQNDDQCSPVTGHMSSKGHRKFSQVITKILEKI